MSKHQDPETTSLHPDKHHIPQRSRNVFILKSLSIILTLTFVVLAINYYLISMCPAGESVSSQHPNAISPRLLEHTPQSTKPFNRVSVSVYYEVLCPDSKSFILHQLVPVQRKYRNLINVRFVPFGKARYHGQDGELQFTCQHGPEECHGNKLHACIVDTHPDDESLQTSIISCSMDRYRLWGSTINSITQVTKECRDKYTPGDDSPLVCSNASMLLKKHGYETLNLKPAVTFIPTIAVDGSLSNQPHHLRDLDGSICKSLKNKNPKSTEIPC